MKKIIGLFAIILFTLTACGEMSIDTLSCTSETSSNALTSRTTYDVDYRENMVKKLKITYDYIQSDTTQNEENDIDGAETGTDGVTSDNGDVDNNEIIDGVVGNAIDSVINAVSDAVLDIIQLQDRHANVQNMYGNINGFYVQNTTNSDDNHYTVTYVIDFDEISDDDLISLNISRNFDDLYSQYIRQGFTCY